MSHVFNQIEVSLPVCPKDGHVKLNGIELRDVRSVSIKSAVDEVTEVTITLLAHVNHQPVAS